MRKQDWPQDLNTPNRVLGNFRPDRFADVLKRQPAPPWMKKRERREGNSAAHLALIRQLWCSLGVEREGIEPHHLKGGSARKERGTGMKATDQWAVPLVWFRHDELERMGSRREFGFFMEQGINPYALAIALYANTGDLPRMGRVLVAHQLDADRRKAQAKNLSGLIVDLTPDDWHQV